MKKILKLFLSCGVLCGISLAPFSVSANESNLIALDVRTPEEFAESHLVGSVNVDFLAANFKEEISKYDQTKTYKVYCRSGNRSGQAVKIMQSLGFIDVENLGSIKDAAEKLHRNCEGAHPSC